MGEQIIYKVIDASRNTALQVCFFINKKLVLSENLQVKEGIRNNEKEAC